MIWKSPNQKIRSFVGNSFLWFTYLDVHNLNQQRQNFYDVGRQTKYKVEMLRQEALTQMLTTIEVIS